MDIKTLSDSIAECETVAFDIADLDFSSFFSQAENQIRLEKINRITNDGN